MKSKAKKTIKQKVSFKKGLLISSGSGFLFILLLIGVEIVFRILRGVPDAGNVPVFFPWLKTGQIARFVELHHWELIPDSYAVTLNDVVYRINSKGYRGPDFSKKRPKYVYRILAAGDSCYFGWEMPESSSFPAVLRKNFHTEQYRRKIEVINAGVPGRTAYQGLIALKKRWLDLDPQMIIFGFGFNDAKTILEGSFPDWIYHKKSQNRQYRINLIASRSALISYFRSFSLKKKLSNRVKRAYEKMNAENKRMARSMKNKTAEKSFAAGARGVADEIMLKDLNLNKRTNPDDYAFEGEKGELIREAEVLKNEVARVSTKKYRECMLEFVRICRENEIIPVFLPISVKEEYLRIMREAARNTNTTYIDTEKILWKVCCEILKRHEKPQPLFKNYRDNCRDVIYMDDCHPTRLGNWIIARKAYAVVSELVTEDIRRRYISETDTGTAYKQRKTVESF